MRFIWIILLLTCSLSAQQFSTEVLNEMEDEALLTLFNEVDEDSIKAKKAARTYLDKARKENEQLIEDLKLKNLKFRSIIWIVSGILSVSFFTILIYHRKQQIYKFRSKDLMNQKNTLNTNRVSILPTDVNDDIINKLETFEKKKGYLKCDISIIHLAKTFGTNQKYLSKVINIEKENNFSQYLNDLRVAYVFTELQTNNKLRNFTIIAIAKESGFKNAESFSKAFYKKYKIKPSFYLKQLSRG